MIRVLAVAAALVGGEPVLESAAVGGDGAGKFGVSVRAVGAVPMLSQVGYAIGPAPRSCPLGDIFHRRRLIATLLVAVTLAVMAVATSRNLPWLAVASLAVGVTTVIPQVLLPFAAQLSCPDRRGWAVGTVMLGLLLGILPRRRRAG